MAEAETKKKLRKRARENIDLKLEEFYNDLTEEEKLEKLEDIRRLAIESKELLRKVDSLVEILLKAAQAPEEDEAQKYLKHLDDAVQEVLLRLQTLEEIEERVGVTSDGIVEIRKTVEDLKAFVEDNISKFNKDASEQLSKFSEILPSISKRMDTLGELAKRQTEVYQKVIDLESATKKLRKDVVDKISSEIKALESTLPEKETLLTEFKRTRAAVKKVYNAVKSLEEEIPSSVGEKLAEIATLRESLNEISREIASIKEMLLRGDISKLSEIEKSVAALEDIEEAVKSLQASVPVITEKIDDVRADVKAIPTKLEELDDIKDAVSSLSSSLQSLSTELEEMEKNLSREVAIHAETLSEKLEQEDLKQVLDEIRDYIKRQYEEKTWEEEHIANLEKEVEALSTAISALTKLTSESIEDRKKSISELNKRIASVIKELHAAATMSDEKSAERIDALAQSLQAMLSSLSESLARLEEQEEREREFIEHYLQDMNKRIELLNNILESGVTPKLLDAVKGEMSSLSKQLAKLTDMMRKNTKALATHSGDVAELISRINALDAKVAEVEESLSSPDRAKLVEMQKEIEEEIKGMREQLVTMSKHLREQPKQMRKEINSLKNALSIVHSEITGVLEAIRKYDVTGSLAELSKRLEALEKKVESSSADSAELSRELADIEERLSFISTIVSESDLVNVKKILSSVQSRMEELYSRLKDAKAVLDEKEVKDIIRDLESIRAQARQLRDAGLADQLDELRGKIRALKKVVEEEHEAVKSGKAHHVGVMEGHADVKKLIVPVRSATESLALVAREKEAHAKEIKKRAKKLAKKTGSSHAHLVAAHAERIIRTAKASKEIEKIVKRIETLTSKAEQEAGKKKGSSAKNHLDVITESVVSAAAKKLAVLFRNAASGESYRSDELAERMGIPEEVVKRALDVLESAGEIPIRLKKPVLPFLGGHYTVIRL